MSRWLFKEEPTHYAFADLVRDRRTVWNGVHNPLALRHLRATRVGDEVFYYHSGSVRAITGIARVVRGPRADDSDGRPSVAVDIAAVRPLRRDLPIGELKTDPALNGFMLFRIGRLSIVPVTDAQWSTILARERRVEGAPVSRGRSPPPGGRRG